MPDLWGNPTTRHAEYHVFHDESQPNAFLNFSLVLLIAHCAGGNEKTEMAAGAEFIRLTGGAREH